MIEIINSPWAISVGSGVLVLIVGGIWKFFIKGTKKEENKNDNQLNSTQIINISNPSLERNLANSGGRSIDFKSAVKILFIEDDTFKQIKNLKKAGWQVTQIKDVKSLDIPEIRDAHIIFVDYQGVGEKSGDQGRGLVKRLKQQYGEAKWIIFYSAHPFTLDVYDIGANSFLAKNSDFYEIENKIIEGAKHLL